MMTNNCRPIDYDRYYDQIWTFAEVGAPNQYMIVELITGAILSGVKCKTL